MPALDERLLFAVILAGAAVAAGGYGWLLVRGWRSSPWWGLAAAFFAPVGGAAYAITHWRRAAGPAGVMAVGGLLVGMPVAVNRLFPPPAEVVREADKPDGPRDTLTGATETPAAAYLREHRDAAVVQMANRADVTDDTLTLLKGMPNLRELDLNDTPITDAGLAVLAELPKLEALRIARTKVTPAGVEAHVLSRPGLKSLDVSGLNVPAAALREWKNADPKGRRYVN